MTSSTPNPAEDGRTGTCLSGPPDGERGPVDRYAVLLGECYELVSHAAAMEARRSRKELRHDDDYRELCDRLAEIERTLDDLIDEFDESAYERAFRRVFEARTDG